MNSGDGWYGGVFVSALYSLAFTTKNVEELVEKSLITIPKESTFYQCINDVLMWYKKYPNDWMATWYELHKKWNIDVGCPKGVFLSFNIDAKINSAYVAIGLLYGKGDFSKSIDISTRCGQDSDCNPATVGGVLGVMNGYSNIPDFWLNPLKEIEHLNFEGTTVSLNKAYDLSYKHSLEMVKKNGGEVQEDKITIIVEEPKPVALEQNFINTYPSSRQKVDLFTSNEYNFDFTGSGFVIYGNLIKTEGIKENYLTRVANRFGSEIFALAELSDSYVASLDVYIDGKLDHKVVMPMKNSSRRIEPAWKYQLEDKEHKVKVVWTNPKKGYSLRINDLIIYSSSPATPNFN
jgi:hypothetical protein